MVLMVSMIYLSVASRRYVARKVLTDGTFRVVGAVTYVFVRDGDDGGAVQTEEEQAEVRQGIMRLL